MCKLNSLSWLNNASNSYPSCAVFFVLATLFVSPAHIFIFIYVDRTALKRVAQAMDDQDSKMFAKKFANSFKNTFST
jgi:hypothetical protein